MSRYQMAQNGFQSQILSIQLDTVIHCIPFEIHASIIFMCPLLLRCNTVTSCHQNTHSHRNSNAHVAFSSRKLNKLQIGSFCRTDDKRNLSGNCWSLYEMVVATYFGSDLFNRATFPKMRQHSWCEALILAQNRKETTVRLEQLFYICNLFISWNQKILRIEKRKKSPAFFFHLSFILCVWMRNMI